MKKLHTNQKIALARIEYLLSLARDIHIERSELADRYTGLARKLSMKYKVPFTKRQKLLVCKKCNGFISLPGAVRVRKGRVIVSCRKCGFIKRIPFKK